MSPTDAPQPDRSPADDSSAPARSTRIVGVLGGIASGKSALARLLAGPAGIVIDADRIARDVLEERAVVARLRELFGAAIVRDDGSVDRERLAARVFASPDERRELEALTHPRIRDRIRTTLEAALARGVPRVALDVPLLVENDAQHGLLARCDELWFVDASLESRDARAQASRGWKAGEVERRESAQAPLNAKRALAHVVITNEGTLADLERAVESALARRSAGEIRP